MSEFINFAKSNYSSQIKQQVLLFDQIGVRRLGRFIPEEIGHSNISKDEPNQNFFELKWLFENEILFDPQIRHIDLDEIHKILGENFASQYDEANKEVKRIIESGKKKGYINIKEGNKAFQSIEKLDQIVLRLISKQIEKHGDFTAVTTLSEHSYTYETPSSKKNNVIQIVINNLPLPNIETSWEKIIDYRNDPDNNKDLLNLRRWIRKISSEEISPVEVQEEIEWLQNEFQAHMKYHRIKANTETLEVLVKAPLEIIEDLVKLKLSKIPEPLFALKKKQLMLMEAEINAPGKEMAYIIKSRETFPSEE
jgi:hypothetical protein